MGDPRKPKEARAEEQRIRAFAKDVVWKYLEQHTKNVLDAQKLLKMADHVLKTSCETMVLQYKQKIEKSPMTEVMIAPSLQIKDYKDECEFLKVFNDEKSEVAYDIIRQMNGAIQGLVNSELKERKLETLPVEFLK